MADVQLEENLIAEFDEFGIDIAGNIGILEKLSQLCKSFNLKTEDMVAQWCSYAFKATGSQDISEDALEQFEKKQLLKHDKKHQSSKKIQNIPRQNAYTAKNINTISNDAEDENSMLGSYVTTPEGKDSIKRLHTTPEQIISKRFALGNAAQTPISSNFSPASFPSPVMATPSAKYESRTSKGDVVATYGISEKTGIDWKGSSKNLRIRVFDADDESSLRKPYKHMFQKLQDKADVLNEMITALSHEMKETLMLDEIENVCLQTQEDVIVSGRICCDSVGRMNAKSIVLEGSRETSAGQRIPLDLSDLKNYSLFPGQIVAIQGKNMTGSSIHPSAIYKGTRLPFYSASKKLQTIDEAHFTMYIACGPYATCEESLSYKPLEDLLKTIEKEAPDILVLLGPFVDSKQPLIEKGDIDESFEDLFSMCCSKIRDAVKNLATNVVLIPSQRDVFHEYVYPQPPFEPIKNDKFHMMSDPCTLLINDVCFGLTSTDILFHLGAEEVSAFANRSDRLGRLADHLLMQQCYYPLHPTHEDVNMDYEHFESHAFMPITPDVLVVPSDLRYFVKDVDGCLCVNPGRLIKGQIGGTFIKLLVKPKKPTNANRSSVVGQSIAQVVRV